MSPNAQFVLMSVLTFVIVFGLHFYVYAAFHGFIL